MNGDIAVLMRRYRSRGVLVDTNLLLLLLVGSLDVRLIATFKRTQSFVAEDFDTLTMFLAKFKTRVTTPSVLTEVSNLARGLGSRFEEFLGGVFSQAAKLFTESHIPSKNVAYSMALGKFGLTDCVLMKAAKGKYLLLTEDFRLSQYFGKMGGDAVNFNHIRMYNWH